jgi:hypothetical protein
MKRLVKKLIRERRDAEAKAQALLSGMESAVRDEFFRYVCRLRQGLGDEERRTSLDASVKDLARLMLTVAKKDGKPAETRATPPDDAGDAAISGERIPKDEDEVRLE